MGIIYFFFGFKGRIGRGLYWGLQILQLLFLFVGMALVGMIGEITGAGQIDDSLVWQVGIYAVFAAYCVMVVASHARRWHDLGSSGWWQLVVLIPFGALYVLIMCGFVRGDRGPNYYGPDPLQKDGTVPEQRDRHPPPAAANG